MYRGCDSERMAKYGWSRSKFFSSMKHLVDAGLAKKDHAGNWALLSRRSLRADTRHRSTMLLNTDMDQRAVRDSMILKMMEMGHRQKLYKFNQPNNKKFSTRRKKLIEQGIRFEEVTTELVLKIGEPIEETEKVAQRTGYVPMNTKSLMRTTGLKKAALLAWKKRAKGSGWIDQQDRSWDLPPELYGLLPEEIPSIEKACRGAISFSSSRNVFKFHQASRYKLLISYKKC